MNKKVYYNQADSRWASHPYPSSSLPKATIKSGGCGATSSAMLISSLTNTVIRPDTLGDIFVKKGIRVNGGTDLTKAVKYIKQEYKLDYFQAGSDSELINYVANGYVAICSVYGGSVFSTGGHIIFVCGYANGMIQVHDPYLYTNKFNSNGRQGKVKLEGNDVWISIDNWNKYAKSNLKYVFSVPNEESEDITVQRYVNGPKSQNVYADINLTTKTGSLDRNESCECLGIYGNRAIVRYKVNKTNNYKIGFVADTGGIR